MGLSKAANYFARTEIEGWSGTAWVPTGAKGALMPYDRFISEREFGLKRRFLLVDPAFPIPDAYKVIRFKGQTPVYMAGVINKDIQVDEYSHVQLLHAAAYTATLYNLVKAAAASGMAKTATLTAIGTYRCDVERVTYDKSLEFQGMRMSEAVVIFPAGTPVTVDHEVKVDAIMYSVAEVYASAGFLYCRAIAKRAT